VDEAIFQSDAPLDFLKTKVRTKRVKSGIAFCEQGQEAATLNKE